MISTNEEKIREFLFRGTETVLPSREFVRDRLMSGEQLKVYLGIDPTGPTLHIGHTIAIRKLAQLQALGHKIILLVGNFTAQIGDPTDKMAARSALTAEQVAENLKNYKVQASKLLSFEGDNAAEFKLNNDWLGKMNFADVLALASKVTVQQMLERDMFKKRMEEGKPIYIHEFMYPLMQGQDSVELMVDGEIGGNDQVFNMLVGRDLLKEHGKDKFVMSVKLLTDPNGKKMGKSEGNMITLEDSAEIMFGKIMSWTDGMIVGGFELCTDVNEDEITHMAIGMQNGENPMEYKKRLAREVITLYHGAEAAQAAQQSWEKTFSEGGVPADMPELKVVAGTALIDALTENGIIESKSEFRRLVEEGALKILKDGDEEKIADVKQVISESLVLKIGKKKFVRITV
jgi:tyrosyl-tRNA synthetase